MWSEKRNWNVEEITNKKPKAKKGVARRKTIEMESLNIKWFILTLHCIAPIEKKRISKSGS